MSSRLPSGVNAALWTCPLMPPIRTGAAPLSAMFTTPALDYVGMTSCKGRVRSYPEKRSRVSGQPLYNGEFPVSVMAVRRVSLAMPKSTTLAKP